MSLQHQFEVEELKGTSGTIIATFLEYEEKLRNADGNYDLLFFEVSLWMVAMP